MTRRGSTTAVTSRVGVEGGDLGQRNVGRQLGLAPNIGLEELQNRAWI